jgi:hypothetical protein
VRELWESRGKSKGKKVIKVYLTTGHEGPIFIEIRSFEYAS